LQYSRETSKSTLTDSDTPEIGKRKEERGKEERGKRKEEKGNHG
jgi:hypothetical protein